MLIFHYTCSASHVGRGGAGERPLANVNYNDTPKIPQMDQMGLFGGAPQASQEPPSNMAV